MPPETVSVDPHETLYLPMRRRFMSEYVSTPEGSRELRIYYGLKEITFDEPELYAFGENLLKQDEFMAGSATTWSEGAPHDWDRVKEMLEALLAEGILSRETPKASTETEYHRRMLELEARREAPTEPLWWNPDCARVTERLTGRPMELGFLESMLPVHRIAHPALDAEGRHVGESNVFPDTMRMKLQTEWRSCPYAGSRFRDDALMNMTALKSMTRNWKPTLQGVLAVREHFLRRYPLPPDGRWRLGDLHALSCAVLAVPTLMLMRENNPIPNGQLDPVLSSIFRVTDGVRMVALYLLFLPEQPMTYETPLTPAELHAVTEKGNHFLSTRGVCAGPPHMVDEFFETLMDGKPVAGAPMPGVAWEAEIPAAIDYGLRGIQLYCLQFTLWIYMSRAYEAVRAALASVEEGADNPWGRLRKRIERDWKIIMPTRQHTALQRNWAVDRYVELFDRAQRGLRDFQTDSAMRLQDVFSPNRDAVDHAARQQLLELVRARAGSAPGERTGLAEAVVDALAEYLTLERSTLRALEDVQRKVNALLQRPHPERRISNLDVALHLRLRLGTMGVLPYLLDVFRDELDLVIETTPDAIRFSRDSKA